jgi:hypothetical protein
MPTSRNGMLKLTCTAFQRVFVPADAFAKLFAADSPSSFASSPREAGRNTAESIAANRTIDEAQNETYPR